MDIRSKPARPSFGVVHIAKLNLLALKTNTRRSDVAFFALSNLTFNLGKCSGVVTHVA